MTTAAAPGTEGQMRQDLTELIRLVEESRVEEARRLAPELAARWPASREIQHLARVLEPPKARLVSGEVRGRSFRPDHEWRRQHGHEYPGCWLATLEDRLIAADPDLGKVLEAVRASVDLDRELPLLQYQAAE